MRSMILRKALLQPRLAHLLLCLIGVAIGQAQAFTHGKGLTGGFSRIESSPDQVVISAPSIIIHRSTGKVDLSFSLSQSAPVQVRVINSAGEQVVVLFDEELESGAHELSFFFNDLKTEQGIFIVSLKAGTQEINTPSSAQ